MQSITEDTATIGHDDNGVWPEAQVVLPAKELDLRVIAAGWTFVDVVGARQAVSIQRERRFRVIYMMKYNSNSLITWCVILEYCDRDLPERSSSVIDRTLQHRAVTYFSGRNYGTRNTVMSVDAALQAAISSSAQCVAAGYVDLVAGVIIGVKTLHAYPQELLDFLALASADMFQGPNVVGIENAFKRARNNDRDQHHYFQEILVTSDHLVHVFLRSKKNQDHASCFVFRKSVSIGLAMTESRAAMQIIEAAAAMTAKSNMHGGHAP